jgi:hypothetical protein
MNMAWHYNFKVIPTEFRKLDGTRTATNQFSVTRHEKALSQMSSRLPGINFHFEIAPIAVIKVDAHFGGIDEISESDGDSPLRRSFRHLCLRHHRRRLDHLVDSGLVHPQNKQAPYQNGSRESGLINRQT